MNQFTDLQVYEPDKRYQLNVVLQEEDAHNASPSHIIQLFIVLTRNDRNKPLAFQERQGLCVLCYLFVNIHYKWNTKSPIPYFIQTCVEMSHESNDFLCVQYLHSTDHMGMEPQERS